MKSRVNIDYTVFKEQISVQDTEITDGTLSALQF